MMTTSSPISADQAARYYRHYRTENAKEYYVEGDVEGEWAGKGAARLGLSGGVSGATFKRVLDGRHPTRDEQLVRGSSAKDGKRVAGWDVTFAAPKSVSLVGLIGRDERVIRAHDEAVRVALAGVENLARARVAERKRGDLSGNVVAALFRHETSRDLDPHLHTHSVVVNMTRSEAGDWRALDSTVLFELQRYGTTLYRNALAEALLAAGYELRHGRHGQIEIDGVTDEQIEHFSKRHEAIWSELRAIGRDDPAAQQRVQRSSRRRKQHVERAELEASWGRAEVALGMNVSGLVSRSREVGPSRADSSSREERAREAVTYAIAHTTEREAVVPRAAVVEAALARRLGYVGREEVERELERRVKAREVVPNAEHPEYVTTREMIGLETEIRSHFFRSRRAAAAMVDEPNFSAFTLSDSQAAAAREILGSTDRLMGLHGVAGAGKTYTLKAVKAEAERHGFIVRGFAPTTGAVAELAKSEIECKTVAAHISSPGSKPDAELWIVDEASLLSTRQLHRLLAQAETARARVVLVGDTRQHAGVEAGSPFRLLLASGMRRAELSEIRRQEERTPLHTAVTFASRGHAARAAATLDASDAVTEIADWDERHATIADRYAERPDGTLIVAPSNAERNELNLLIRDRLRETGRIGTEDVTVRTLRALDLTGVEREVAAKYEIGNVVLYRTTSRKVGIAKESYAVVVAKDVARNRITVRMGNGETREYDPRRLKGVDVYVEESRGISEGDRIQFRAALRRPKIANGAIATVLALEADGTATIQVDEAKTPIRINLNEARHIDYGYAVTSYSSQGKTVDRALVTVRTKHHKQLVNQSQFYVSISRARSVVEVFTDSREALPRAASREVPKASALTFDLGL